MNGKIPTAAAPTRTGWRKAIPLIPNAMTAANIFCGFYAIICAINGQLILSAWLVIVAGLFDLVDGRVARMLKASSEFGGHFDTLSDQLSFGVAPAFLIYQAGLRDLTASSFWLDGLLPFLYALSVSFRLARFSVQTTEKGFFQGLSSPVSACTVATMVLFLSVQEFTNETRIVTLAVASLVLAILMSSRMRFPSFKDTKWRSPVGYLIMTVGIIGLAVCLIHPTLFLFPALSIFIIGVLMWNLVSQVKMHSGQGNLTRE